MIKKPFEIFGSALCVTMKYLRKNTRRFFYNDLERFIHPIYIVRPDGKRFVILSEQNYKSLLEGNFLTRRNGSIYSPDPEDRDSRIERTYPQYRSANDIVKDREF